MTLMPHLLPFLSFARARTRAGDDASVEWDDVCSGRGLVLAYAWCREREGSATTAPELSDAADIGSSWRTNETARAALLLYYEIIMRFSANMCIAVQAFGLVFAGDNQVRDLQNGWMNSWSMVLLPHVVVPLLKRPGRVLRLADRPLLLRRVPSSDVVVKVVVYRCRFLVLVLCHSGRTTTL